MVTGPVGPLGDTAQHLVVVEFKLGLGHVQTQVLGMEDIIAQETTHNPKYVILSTAQVCHPLLGLFLCGHGCN